jgi:Calcium/calmodulin dependent protein kinase II Association.
MLKSLLAAGLIAATITAPAPAEDVASTIIAMERAAFDKSDTGDVMAFVAISAPDVVYQDPSLTAPIKGIDALRAFYKNFPVDKDPIPGVMKNASVQSYGDVAILSFHFISRAASKHPVEWNASEVYRKTEAGWRIVNTHWSLTTPAK